MNSLKRCLKTFRNVLILLSSVITPLSHAISQCTDSTYCNDNIPCTRDICFHGYCNYQPLTDTCYNHLCHPGHCKIIPYWTDTCGCLDIITSSELTFDSVIWTINGVDYMTLSKTICIPDTGLVDIHVSIHSGANYYTRQRQFYFPECNVCEKNIDCDDNSACTIDWCINNRCVNKNAYLNGSMVSFEQWRRDCCRCGN